MRRIQWVLLGIAAVIVIVVLYVLIAKPTLVLPTVTVRQPQGSVLQAYLRQLNVNQLDLRVRTDGKMIMLADGRELGYVTYTPATLSNALQVAGKVAMTEDTARTVRLIPVVFPALTSNLLLTSMAGYYVLPMEITFRFPRE